MNSNTLFCYLTSDLVAEFIRNAKDSVCFAGPGIQLEPAKALVEVADRIGPEMVTVSLDFSESVMRMGYGTLEAVKCLKDAGIVVNHAPKLRNALIIVDRKGFIFTPTALYLEQESTDIQNALRLSSDQVAEALARLSPAAKALAIAQSTNQEEKSRIAAIPVEVSSEMVSEAKMKEVDKGLELAPPVKFDIARQVRVFEPYLQYVDLSLTGAALQRRKLPIPPSIQKLGGGKELENRLHTNFDLIEKGSKLSSKSLEDDLNEIRKNFTPSLKDFGRVVLKSAKPHLLKRLEALQEDLSAYQDEVKKDLQKYLDDSQDLVVEYYLPIVMQSPTDALLGQSLGGEVSENGARIWLFNELKKVFPQADSLIDKMQLDVQYKDVTFETLNRDNFIELVKAAFPGIDWDKTYDEYRAMGESNSKGDIA